MANEKKKLPNPEAMYDALTKIVTAADLFKKSGLLPKEVQTALDCSAETAKEGLNAEPVEDDVEREYLINSLLYIKRLAHNVYTMIHGLHGLNDQIIIDVGDIEACAKDALEFVGIKEDKSNQPLNLDVFCPAKQALINNS